MEGRGGATEPHPALPQPLTSSHCWHGDQTVISSCHFLALRREVSQKAPLYKRRNQRIRKRQRDEFWTSEVTMQMTLLSITVWFAHFLITPALYFNTPPANTVSDYTETPPITTTTTTNQKPEILKTATPSPPLNTTKTQDIKTDSPTEADTQLKITPNVTFAQETTSLHQYNSNLSQNDVMGDNVSISNPSDITMSHRNTLHNPTTVSTNFARLTPHEDDRNETGTTSSLSSDEDGQTVQTPDPFNSISTASWTEDEDEITKSDEGHYETNSTPATFANTDISRLTTHIDDKNETATMLSFSEDGHTVQTPDPFNSASTASWKEEEDKMTKSNEGYYETNSTQAIFANMDIARRLTPHIDDKNETGTISNGSYSEDGHTGQTPDPFNSVSTASWKEEEDETTTSDEGNYETNSTQDIFANMNISRLTTHIDDKNETGTISNLSYSEDGHTVQTPFNIVSTASWTDDETTKSGDGDYETNSTQATFANTNEWTGTGATEGSYNFTSKHGEEDYNLRPTLQTTDIPMITPTQDPTVSELHTSTDKSTTPQNIYRFTSSVGQTENITGTDTPSGTTYTTNSITTSVLTDNSINATTDKINKTDTESKGWPTCFNSESQSRQSMLVCFITIWTLAMTATIFLGISIFLWVRLSVFKKKMKQKEKGGHARNKESLWADPKATVQERVEFWYVNGSTLEADRKERKRQERMKRRGHEQDTQENELWIQPRVTVDDITEFWYANRRRNETMY